MAKAGRPKQDVTKEQNVCFRLTKEEYDRLRAYARAKNRTVTKVLQECVSHLINDKAIRDLQSEDERRNDYGSEKRSEGQGT